MIGLGVSASSFGALQVGGLNVNGGFSDGSGVITTTVDLNAFPSLAAHEYSHRILGGGPGGAFRNISITISLPTSLIFLMAISENVPLRVSVFGFVHGVNWTWLLWFKGIRLTATTK